MPKRQDPLSSHTLIVNDKFPLIQAAGVEYAWAYDTGVVELTQAHDSNGGEPVLSNFYTGSSFSVVDSAFPLPYVYSNQVKTWLDHCHFPNYGQAQVLQPRTYRTPYPVPRTASRLSLTAT